MATVYKSMSSSLSKEKAKKPVNDDAESKYRQRVLILSSRGVTYRYTSHFPLPCQLSSSAPTDCAWQTPAPP